MDKSRSIVAGALFGLALTAAGLLSIPTAGNAGIASANAADRINGAFALLADASPRTTTTVGAEVRTVTVGYQTDTTAALLIRKPGALQSAH